MVGTVGEVSEWGNSADVVVNVASAQAEGVESQSNGAVFARVQNLPNVGPGDTVRLQANRLESPASRATGFEYSLLERKQVRAVAVTATGTVLQQATFSPGRLLWSARNQLIAAIRSQLAEPYATLLGGIAFGTAPSLDHPTHQALQITGLAHIVATSGLKVAIVLAIFARLCAWRGWSWRRTAVITLVGLATFVLLSGSTAAALRSSIMASAAMLARRDARKTDSLPMLSATALLLLLIDPGLIGDAGFQLTFLGTLGILVFTDVIEAHVPGPRLLREPFAITVAAQLATIPVMATNFGLVSLVGPVANALVLPALPVLVVLGWLGALSAAIAPEVGWAPLHLAGFLVQLVVRLADVLASTPFASISVPSWPTWLTAIDFGVVAALGVLVVGGEATDPAARHFPARKVAVVVVASGLIVGIAGFTNSRSTSVHLLAVGAAPSVLIETSEGTTIVVDTGASGQLLLNALGQQLPITAHQIDLLVLTGSEKNASGGVAELGARYHIGSLVLPSFPMSRAARDAIAQLQLSGTHVALSGVSQSFVFGNSSLRFLDVGGAAGVYPMCALQFRNGGMGILALGDMAVQDQDELAAVYGISLRSDLLISPPGATLSQALLRAVDPAEIVVPSAAHAPHRALGGHWLVRWTGDGGAVDYP
jgi:competence protein ComEC